MSACQHALSRSAWKRMWELRGLFCGAGVIKPAVCRMRRIVAVETVRWPSCSRCHAMVSGPESAPRLVSRRRSSMIRSRVAAGVVPGLDFGARERGRNTVGSFSVVTGDEGEHPLQGDAESGSGLRVSEALLADGADDNEVLRFRVPSSWSTVSTMSRLTGQRSALGACQRRRDSCVKDQHQNPRDQAANDALSTHSLAYGRSPAYSRGLGRDANPNRSQ